MSGSQGTLLSLSPIRTVRAGLLAHGSSTLRTTRLLVLILHEALSDSAFICQYFLVVVQLTIAHRSLGLRVDLLVTKEMNEYKVAVGVFTSLGSCPEMMDVEFLIVEE